jgi:hypothetical protein
MRLLRGPGAPSECSGLCMQRRSADSSDPLRSDRRGRTGHASTRWAALRVRDDRLHVRDRFRHLHHSRTLSVARRRPCGGSGTRGRGSRSRPARARCSSQVHRRRALRRTRRRARGRGGCTGESVGVQAASAHLAVPPNESPSLQGVAFVTERLVEVAHGKPTTSRPLRHRRCRPTPLGRRNGMLAGWHPVDSPHTSCARGAPRPRSRAVDDVITGCARGHQALNIGQRARSRAPTRYRARRSTCGSCSRRCTSRAASSRRRRGHRSRRGEHEPGADGSSLLVDYVRAGAARAPPGSSRKGPAELIAEVGLTRRARRILARVTSPAARAIDEAADREIVGVSIDDTSRLWWTKASVGTSSGWRR